MPRLQFSSSLMISHARIFGAPDSVPETEYIETVNKAKAVVKALEAVSNDGEGVEL